MIRISFRTRARIDADWDEYEAWINPEYVTAITAEPGEPNRCTVAVGEHQVFRQVDGAPRDIARAFAAYMSRREWRSDSV